MIAKQKPAWYFFLFITLLLTLLLTIAGCSSTPTPKPQLTFALEVNPGAKVQVGKSVAVVAKVEPLEALDLKWSITGTADGKLNTATGEQVVYTAGKEGTDIVVAEGTTASGTPIKQTVTLTVEGEAVVEVPTQTGMPATPTDTPTATLTPTPSNTPAPMPTLTPTSPPSVTPTFTPPPPPPLEEPPNVIELNPADFETQDADGDGIKDEFILFTNYERSTIPLPVQDGIDLSDYNLEFEFEGADGRAASLWYKSHQDWTNVVSFPILINSGQPVRYNPFADGRSVDESEQGFDFAHIWAVGVKISEGVEGVRLISARLINRSVTQVPCSESRITSPSGTQDRGRSANFPVLNTFTISWEPADCRMTVEYYQNDQLQNKLFDVTSGTSINISNPGETEIKIWEQGNNIPSDSMWVSVGDCFNAKITSPAGADQEAGAGNIHVSSPVTISWEPASCEMVVQYYQAGNCYPVVSERCEEQPPVASGVQINIPPGITELKIWHGDRVADNNWVSVD